MGETATSGVLFRHCWQERKVLSVCMCVFTVYFTRVVQPQHVGRAVALILENLDSPVPHQCLKGSSEGGRQKKATAPMRLSLRAHRQSCFKVLLDVTQSPAIRLQFKRKTAQPDPLTREKWSYPIVKQLKRDSLAALIESVYREEGFWKSVTGQRMIHDCIHQYWVGLTLMA